MEMCGDERWVEGLYLCVLMAGGLHCMWSLCRGFHMEVRVCVM